MMILRLIFCLLVCFNVAAESSISLTLEDNLFVRISVPKKGIVCSNQTRAERLSKYLNHVETYEIPWGPKIFIGSYHDEKVFIASAPVGSGSGLMFTELYSAGAEYIIRYGSDDVKDPKESEKNQIKIIDEADNLYGYNMASGVEESEWGKSIFASKTIINALMEESKLRKLSTDTRICHHLENYHSLRTPDKFSTPRRINLERQLENLKRNDKNESYDMESAVLFRVAKDFDKHAASVLQTVNKENKKLGPYEGQNKKQALKMEKLFIDYLLSSLIRIP